MSLMSLAKEYSEHHTYELSGKSGIPPCNFVTSGFFYYATIIFLRLPTLMLLLLLYKYVAEGHNVLWIDFLTSYRKIRFHYQTVIECMFFRYWFTVFIALIILVNGILAFLTLRPSFSKTAWTCCTSIAAPTCFISRFKVFIMRIYQKIAFNLFY